jgi:1-acyl-sn-glycerol-3-phosphate acyltransferase
MPLPPLTISASPLGLLVRVLKVLPALLLQCCTVLLYNATQLLSLLVLPLSRRAFRGINRRGATWWWGWSCGLARLIHGTRLELSGDPLPAAENALVVSNHQTGADITFLAMLAHGKQRAGDLKWFVKHSLKYVPGIGWGMLFLDNLFVKRNWARDQRSIERTFGRLTANRVPVWLVLFAEGTRITADKLRRSQRIMERKGLAPTAEVLYPHTRGFVAAVGGLGNHVAAVYDVTVGYGGGVPSLWHYLLGYATEAHLHVRRFPIAELPTGAAELSGWLLDRFAEKDRLLVRFYRDGRFER